MTASSLSIGTLPYGATVTTTFYTSYSVTSGQSNFVIQFPQVTSSPTIPYTTISTNVGGGSISPTTVPVLVLTQVIGVAISTNGQQIKSATLTEPLPSPASFTTIVTVTSSTTSINSSTDAATAVNVNVPCNSWNGYSNSTRVYIIIGAVVGFLALLGVLFWLWYLWRQGKLICGSRHKSTLSADSALDNEAVLEEEDVGAVGTAARTQEGKMVEPAYRVMQYPRRSKLYYVSKPPDRPPPPVPDGTQSRDFAFSASPTCKSPLHLSELRLGTGWREDPG